MPTFLYGVRESECILRRVSKICFILWQKELQHTVLDVDRPTDCIPLSNRAINNKIV